MCNNNIKLIKQLLCEFVFIESVNIFVFSFKHVFGKYASSESSGRKRRVARKRERERERETCFLGLCCT